VEAKAMHLKTLLMAISHVYVGNMHARVSKMEFEDEFRTYGVIRSTWVASCYAFIDFGDHRDAQDAICDLDGKHN